MKKLILALSLISYPVFAEQTIKENVIALKENCEHFFLYETLMTQKDEKMIYYYMGRIESYQDVIDMIRSKEPIRKE